MFRTTKVKGLAAATGAAAALLAPLALAAPAEASTTKDGCTLTTPAAPTHIGLDSSGRDQIERTFRLTCPTGTSIEWSSELYEADRVGVAGDGNSDEDLVGTATGTNSFVNSGGSVTVRRTRTMTSPPDETDQTAELYQYVKFRVTAYLPNGGTVVGGWSTPEYSPVSTIWL